MKHIHLSEILHWNIEELWLLILPYLSFAYISLILYLRSKYWRTAQRISFTFNIRGIYSTTPKHPNFVWNQTKMTDMILENQHVLFGRNRTNNCWMKNGMRKRFNLNWSFTHNFCYICVINIWLVNSKHVTSALPNFSTSYKIENPICVEYGILSFSTMVPMFRRSFLPPSWGYFMKRCCRKGGKNY